MELFIYFILLNLELIEGRFIATTWKHPKKLRKACRGLQKLLQQVSA